eukprot:scaffold3855_cov199-Alexandrium_tamarense.AAC.41
MDERFYTPRASALSSRSYGSFATARSTASFGSHSSRSMERYQTPRSSLSTGSQHFATPRSTESMVQVHSSYYPSNDYASNRDRSNDFRRFYEHQSSRRHASSSTPSNPHYQECYDHMETGGDYTHDTSHARNSKKNNQEIFSLARHGRAGEVEELLRRGVPVDITDEYGNSILAIGCQNGSKKIVKLALRYGADINAVNSTANTALNFCFK